MGFFNERKNKMIHINNLTKSVTNKTLFENISLKISDKQKVGFVGPNGVGKTTLLKIILGAEEADSGTVDTTGEVIGYLPQKIELRKNTMVYEYLIESLLTEYDDYKIMPALAKVGLGKIDQTSYVDELSGGQKVRLGLAKLLLIEPTLLVLDEPTNNLDAGTLVWLEKFVRNFPGKILLVSHDRSFLDNCVEKIIELDMFTHSIEEYGGNYTYYVEEKKRRQDNVLQDYKIQQKKEKVMKEWIIQKQEQLKYHPSNKVARQLQAMKTRFKREIEDSAIGKPQNYLGFKIATVGEQLHAKKSVLVLKNLHIGNLLSCDELYIYGGDRIVLKGENGTGKSTLVKVILGQNHEYQGEINITSSIKIGYFSQEHETLDLGKTVLDTVMMHTSLASEGDIRSMLGKYLFKNDTVFSLTASLSEGEKARLIIAILIAQKNNFLFLDEPTNHLDLLSREVLEEALRNFEGGFLVISHDRYFIKHIGINRKLVIENAILSEHKLNR